MSSGTDSAEIDFDQFTHADAWALGTAMVSMAVEAGHPVTIAIHFGEQRVFHAAMPGTSATNDDWLARKIRTVYKHNRSSWEMECEQHSSTQDYYGDSGYRVTDLALSGGAVPLRVQSSLIGAVAVSGLASEDDHRFVVEALASHLDNRGGA